jgi:glycosyltransferase involved in cell wall biosynthesis
MRILLLHNRYRQRGGEDVCVDAHQRLLESNGHEVRLVEASNEQISGSVAVMKAAIGWVYSYKWEAVVAREIASFRPQVAHVHNVFPLLSPSVIYACSAAGVPVVQTLHNYRLLCPVGTLFRSGRVCEDCVKTVFPWPGVAHRCYHKSALGTAVVGAGLVAHRLLGTYTRRVDYFVALTEFAREKFISANLPQEKLKVIPNWLASDPGQGDGSGCYFLFVGRLTAEKGVTTLLDAWRKVKPRAVLKVVGTGPLEGAVAAAVEGVASVEHLGYQTHNESLRLIQKATALIVPSQWYEGLPMTIVEAYAAGTPVIASQLGSLTELVADERTGWLFQPGDSDALARKIEWAIANPQILPSMRLAARAEYEGKYTAEHCYRQLIELYTCAIGRGGVGN